MFYPKIMQPSHVKWENIPTPSQHLETQQQQKALTNGHHLTTGTNSHDQDTSNTTQQHPTIFSDVPAIVSRNFLITDTVFESPAVSNLGVPGPDGDIDDLGPNGLTDISQAVIDELPEDCRAAFEEARSRELGWKSKWGSEVGDGCRASLRIGFNGFPV